MPSSSLAAKVILQQIAAVIDTRLDILAREVRRSRQIPIDIDEASS
jgi:hypothetical protein